MAHIVLNQNIVTGQANGVNFEVNLELIPVERRSETVFALIAQGILIIAQRAASGKDAVTRMKETKRTVKEIQDGVYEFGGGGGGPRLSEEDEALRRWLDAKAADEWKGKKSERKEIGARVFPAAVEAAIRQYLIAAMQSAGRTEKEIKETLSEKLEANRAKIKDKFLALPDVQMILRVVQLERNGAQVVSANLDGLDV